MEEENKNVLRVQHKNWQSFHTRYCTWEAILCKLFTLICSNIAVSLEIRSVKFSLSTQSCPVDKVLACLTTSWASSSHLRLRSVGWSAGWRPWSGASCRCEGEKLRMKMSFAFGGCVKWDYFKDSLCVYSTQCCFFMYVYLRAGHWYQDKCCSKAAQIPEKESNTATKSFVLVRPPPTPYSQEIQFSN